MVSKELHSSSISLSPGDFRLLVDFIKGGEHENAVIYLDGCGLSIQAGAARGVVSFNTGGGIEDAAKQFVWTVPIKELSRIADMIPRDSFYWASQSLNLEMDLDKYRSFIGYIRDSDWKKEQDLWVEDREYRKLVAQKDDVDSHLMRLYLQLYDDQIELWIDVNEVCAVIQTEIKCNAIQRTV